MGGSNGRRNIQGYVVSGDLHRLAAFQRLPLTTLRHVLTEARDHGQSVVLLDAEPFTVVWQVNHTFALQPGSDRLLPL